MILCFTDLDGTLLNHDDYQYDAAIPILEKLKAQGIPVIPNTSKTRAEVIDLRQALGLHDPFVVENGSGIFIELQDQRFQIEPDGLEPPFGKKTLGFSYPEAQEQLQQLSQAFETPLQGFGSMTEEELIAATQLTDEDLKRACDREFSEPFIRPTHISVADLATWAQTHQIQILVGNRFCHILGADAGKGNAVHTLKQALRTDEPVITVGLGDSPNDVSMLEAVDIPVVIPGKRGPHPQLANRGWRIAPATGCQGWATAMDAIAQQHKLW